MMTHESNDPIYVIESKKICEEMGLDPSLIPTPQLISMEKLNQIRYMYKKVFEIVDFFFDRFFQMLEEIPILLVVTDNEGTVLELKGNPNIKNIIEELGFQPGVKFTEELNGTNSVSLAFRMNQPIQLIGTQHYHDFLKGTACYSIPFVFENHGTQKGSISIMTLVEYQSPLLLTMLSTIVNSIQREMLLREQNKRLNILNQIVMKSTKNGIIQTDKNGYVTEFNLFAEKLTGWRKEDLFGRLIKELNPIGKYLNQVLQTQKDFSNIEISFINEKSDKQTICLFDGMPLYDKKGRLTGSFGQLRDITERYEAEARINYLAFHDDLTGLPNRRFFHTELKEKLCNAKENKGMLAIFLLDLDRFKIINDTLGHEKGDYLLLEVSNLLKGYLPGNAETFRMGGDEFTIILTDVYQKTEATSIAKGIIQLFQQPFKIQDYDFHISTSIGISFYPHDGHEIGTLFSKADTAMYRAKEHGKNNYMVYHSNMEQRFLDKLTFEKELRHAIQNNHLELHYQPQVDLKTQKILGVEALLRWNHPTLGLIFPGDIIPLAEEMGMAVALGEWVLQRACHQLKSWQDQGFPSITVAVNLSPQEFLKQGLVDKVRQVLIETKLEPRFLELEITESMTMDVNHAIPTLKSLNELGVQIAIDDFGTGYSSLNYLKNFPIHHLKIDQSFVNDIMNDQNDVKIISAIISMAHGLNLEVVAEGVETCEQATFLSNLDCDQAQGYYYSKPLHPDKIEEILFREYMND